MQPMSTSDSTLNAITVAQNAAIAPPPGQEIAINVNNNNTNATPNALVPVATTESVLNSLGSQVTVLKQDIENGAANVLESFVNCCCSPEALIGCCITAAAIAGIAPEVFFIVGAYYCLNDPAALGSICTTGKHGQHHSAYSGGVSLATAAALYPLLLCCAICLRCLKK